MNFVTRLMAAAALSAAALTGAVDKAKATTTYDNAYVYFMLDASGSLSQAGWDAVKSFASSVVQSAPLGNSIIGYNVFSTGLQSQRSFSADQNRTVLSDSIENQPFYSGVTHTRDALQDGINQIQNSASISSYRRIMFLITDGVPVPSRTQNPCSLEASLISNDIELHILGAGSFDASPLSCLLDDPQSRGSIFNIADLDAGDKIDAIFASSVTPVPLPASLPLFGLGALAFVGVRRRSRAGSTRV